MDNMWSGFADCDNHLNMFTLFARIFGSLSYWTFEAPTDSSRLYRASER